MNQLVNPLTTFDFPIEYKKLKFYPIKVKDYFYYTIFSQCLTIDKNSIPDPEVISMGYLQYLFYLTIQNPEKTPYLLWFDRLLALSLRDEESFKDAEKSLDRYSSEKSGKISFTINGEKYGESDFLEIKKIISEQNLLELPDENISKEVRDSLEYAREYKAKLQGTKSGSFEDYMVSLAVATGWSYEYIYELSIRKFLNSIKRLDNLIHYKIFLQASMSGMVEFKDKSFIKHWLSDLSEGTKYEDVSVELSDMENKISMESAKESTN